MRKKFSDITPYITAHIAETAAVQLEPYKSFEIDIAGCHLFDGANAVINDLTDKGFKFVDSKNRLNNDIFEHNRQLKKPNLEKSVYPDKYYESLKELSEAVNRLEENKIYSCRNSDDFPLVLLSQLFKPNIVWYIPDVYFSDFIGYMWKMLYYKSSAPDIRQFISIMAGEEKIEMLAYNTLYAFNKPKNFGIDEECVLLDFDISCTWNEAFYRHKFIPYSVSRKKHIPKTKEDPYYQVLRNISESVKSKKAPKIDLKKFIEGGIL